MINKILGLLGISAKAGKVISGTEIIIEYIEKKKVKLVLIANDSSENTKNKIEKKCIENNVPVKIFGNIEQNSKAIGKNNRAIIGIIEEKLALAILNKISGGE